MSFLKKALGTVSKWIGNGLETVAPTIGQLTGGLLSGVGSAATDYLTRNLGISSAKDLLQMQNRTNLNYALQSARLLPSAQVAGLRAAGINPIAAYGSIGGQLSGGSASPMVATGQSDFNLHSAARLMDAQVDMARAQADEARARASITRAHEQVETDPTVVSADKIGRVASAAKDVVTPVATGVGAYVLAKRKSAKPVSKKSAPRQPWSKKMKLHSPRSNVPRGTSKSAPTSKSKSVRLPVNVPRGTNSARVLAPSVGLRPPVFGGVSPDSLNSGDISRHMYNRYGPHIVPPLQ